MKNTDIVNKLLIMGKIPMDSELSDEKFKEYDELIAMFEESLTLEEAEQVITLFSDDCDDLNWGLLHIIETVPYAESEKYKKIISKCPNEEYREILEERFNNWLKKQQLDVWCVSTRFVGMIKSSRKLEFEEENSYDYGS